MKKIALLSILAFGWFSFFNGLFDWEAPTAKVKQAAAAIGVGHG